MYPTISAPSNVIVDEGASNWQLVTLTGDLGNLLFSASSLNNSLATVVVSGSGSTRNITVVANNQNAGLVTIQLTYTDGASSTATASFSATIVGMF